MSGELLAFATALAYHEAAHLLVADRFEAAKAIKIVRYDHWFWKWLLIGPAIEVNEEILTKRQLETILFAPLALIPVAVILWWIWSITGHGLAITAAFVIGVAGFTTLFSDVPLYYFGDISSERFQTWTLYDLEQ